MRGSWQPWKSESKQEYISSCANADALEAIESPLLNLENTKQNLCLQNMSDLAGPGLLRHLTTYKCKPAPNPHPHPCIALTLYAMWDKV
jgi:hypothetical protein